MRAPLVGIFVGGRSERMGGRPKGRLPTPERGEAIVVRLVRVVREALGDDVEVRLIGRADAYIDLSIEALPDAAEGVGPLGGLIALLEHGQAQSVSTAIALAGDLPFVSAALVQRLAEHEPSADVVAPRSGEIWQPLFARYSCEPALVAARARLAERRRSLQGVIHRLHAVALPIAAGEGELLTDWDSPEDIR